jgi:hypothetical protein
MPQTCGVYNHPVREAIDKVLVAGTALPRIAALYRALARLFAAPVEAGVFEVTRRPAAPVVTQRRGRQGERDPFATLRSLR